MSNLAIEGDAPENVGVVGEVEVGRERI